MKNFGNTNTPLNLSNLRERIRLGLTLVGVVTAIICSLTLLHGTDSSVQSGFRFAKPPTISIEVKDFTKVATNLPWSQN